MSLSYNFSARLLRPVECPRCGPSGCAPLALIVTPLARSSSAATEPRTPTNSAGAAPRRVPIDQPILNSLVIPLAMVVIDEFRERTYEICVNRLMSCVTGPPAINGLRTRRILESCCVG